MIWDANRTAVRHYSPKPYSGDIILFKSIEDGLNSPYGWRELIGGELTEVMIPGDHIEIMREPHVETLAKKLKSYLN